MVTNPEQLKYRLPKSPVKPGFEKILELQNISAIYKGKWGGDIRLRLRLWNIFC